MQTVTQISSGGPAPDVDGAVRRTRRMASSAFGVMVLSLLFMLIANAPNWFGARIQGSLGSIASQNICIYIEATMKTTSAATVQIPASDSCPDKPPAGTTVDTKTDAQWLKESKDDQGNGVTGAGDYVSAFTIKIGTSVAVQALLSLGTICYFVAVGSLGAALHRLRSVRPEQWPEKGTTPGLFCCCIRSTFSYLDPTIAVGFLIVALVCQLAIILVAWPLGISAFLQAISNALQATTNEAPTTQWIGLGGYGLVGSSSVLSLVCIFLAAAVRNRYYSLLDVLRMIPGGPGGTTVVIIQQQQHQPQQVLQPGMAAPPGMPVIYQGQPVPAAPGYQYAAHAPIPVATPVGYAMPAPQGYPSAPQQGYPGAPQQGYPGAPQPGYPGGPAPGYPSAPGAEWSPNPYGQMAQQPRHY